MPHVASPRRNNDLVAAVPVDIQLVQAEELAVSLKKDSCVPHQLFMPCQRASEY